MRLDGLGTATNSSFLAVASHSYLVVFRLCCLRLCVFWSFDFSFPDNSIMGLLLTSHADPMIMFGTGGHTGHSAIAVRENGQLYVCESTDANPFGPVCTHAVFALLLYCIFAFCTSIIVGYISFSSLCFLRVSLGRSIFCCSPLGCVRVACI